MAAPKILRRFDRDTLGGRPARRTALLINPPVYDTQYWAEWAQPYGLLRIARKQVRATCLPLARDVRRLKRTVSALRKTVAVLARLGTELQTERQAERAKLAAAPQEVKAARISPGLIKKLRARLGIAQGELATLVGVSASAVGGIADAVRGQEVAEYDPST
jgi:DNA-binding transcriptional regulator YiaG